MWGNALPSFGNLLCVFVVFAKTFQIPTKYQMQIHAFCDIQFKYKYKKILYSNMYSTRQDQTLHKNTHNYIQVQQYTWKHEYTGYTSLHASIHEYMRVHISIHELTHQYTRVHMSTYKYTWVHTSTQRAHIGTHEYIQVHMSTHKYTQVQKGIQKYTQSQLHYVHWESTVCRSITAFICCGKCVLHFHRSSQCTLNIN